MGYTMNSTGRYADTERVVPLPAQTAGATVTGSPLELGDRTVARLTLDVTDASGTNPTLDVSIETCSTAGGTWRSLGAFAQKTAAGSEAKSFAGLDRFVRAKATIGGTTPSFTLSVSGEAV